MPVDPWLKRWLPLVSNRASEGIVLELGCGSGADTATLHESKLNVVAVERDKDAALLAQAAVPGAKVFTRDLRDPFPVEGQPVITVVASLSLHYFTWPETEQVVQRIHEVLVPGGLLLCRLNSTNDHHFGASGHKLLEKNYFLVEGQPKRFFDKGAIDSLFALGWRTLSLNERTTGKYGRPKALWEVILAKDA